MLAHCTRVYVLIHVTFFDLMGCVAADGVGVKRRTVSVPSSPLLWRARM